MNAAIGASTRVVDIFLRYLAAEEARLVFGVPGGLLHPFFEAIERSNEFELVVTRHEGGAAFMADGVARATGGLAVCASTAGPGATNLLTGVAVAHADGVPMLVITGQPPTRTLGKGAAQEGAREDTDIVAMFSAVTKYSTMITSPDHAARHLRRALRAALTGRPGPVHIHMPVDIWGATAREDWFTPSTYRPPTNVFDRRAVQRAAKALLQAEYPVLLVGSGVRMARAWEQLRALAELLPARVATTPRAKGVFPEDHSLSLGVMGTGGHWEAKSVVFGPDVDVLFCAAAALDETTTINWAPELRPRDSLIQLDIDPGQLGRNYPVEIPLLGDVQTILTELLYQLHRDLREDIRPASRWAEAPPLVRGHRRYLEPHLREDERVPVTPQRWRAELSELLPPDAVVFSDVGGHMLFNIQDLRLRAGQHFALNFGFASMGHGTCAPIGAALAAPKRRVVAIVGDACFAMNGFELLTAVEYDVPVIWIVENNNMQGITWHGSRTVGDGRGLDCVRLRRELKVAEIGAAMGLKTWTARSAPEFRTAFEEALDQDQPALIEVQTDPSVPPPLFDRANAVRGDE